MQSLSESNMDTILRTSMEPRALQTVVAISAISVISTVFVGLRLWTRLAVIRAAGYDDLAVGLSWVCIATFAVV